MRKRIVLTLTLVVLLMLGGSTVLAGPGDPVPGLESYEDACTIDAGPWGWLFNADAWIGTYSNGMTLLKCWTKVDDPPASKYVIKPAGGCQTWTDYTEDSTVKVFPNGHVVLICRFPP